MLLSGNKYRMDSRSNRSSEHDHFTIHSWSWIEILKELSLAFQDCICSLRRPGLRKMGNWFWYRHLWW